jgi:hypothetical protein
VLIADPFAHFLLHLTDCLVYFATYLVLIHGELPRYCG